MKISCFYRKIPIWVVAKELLNFCPKSQTEGKKTELPIRNIWNNFDIIKSTDLRCSSTWLSLQVFLRLLEIEECIHYTKSNTTTSEVNIHHLSTDSFYTMLPWFHVSSGKGYPLLDRVFSLLKVAKSSGCLNFSWKFVWKIGILFMGSPVFVLTLFARIYY